MRFDLAQMVRRAKNPRRSQIPLRPINPPATMATDLFRACYLPVVHAWESAIPRIVAEYERTMSEMTTDSPASIDAEMGFVEQELSRLLLVLTPRLRSWAFRTETWFRGRWRGAVLSATGIDLGTIIGPEDARQTVEAAIQWNVSLIKDVGDQARQRISSAVFSGLTQRKPAREVAKEIRGAVAMSRRRSIGIASDQLSKLSGSLADERRRQAGLPVWEWMHSGKARPRPEHVARNGNLYSDDPAIVGKSVNGKTVRTPPSDRPSQQPYCGCRARAVLMLDD